MYDDNTVASTVSGVMAEPKKIYTGNMTILQIASNNKELIAAKVVTPDPQKDGAVKKMFNIALDFTYMPAEVANMHELSNALKMLADKKTWLIIRGEPDPSVDTSGKIKRRKLNSGLGEGVFISRKDGLQWVMLDFDNTLCPDHIDIKTQPVVAIQYLISLLPEYFHGVTCHYHLSTSAGLPDINEIKVHLWYWLDSPVTDSKLRIWGNQVNKEYGYKIIDIALFDEVQPHYTADPIFKDGAVNPFPDNRSGLIPGDKDFVTMPQITEEVKHYSGCTAGLKTAYSYQDWLTHLGDHEGGLGFREVLLHATWYYVLENGADGTDVEALKADLRNHIDAADQSLHTPSEIEERKSDACLNGMIKGAMAKIGAVGKQKLIHDLQPFYPVDKVFSVEEASNELRARIQSFVKNPHNMGIRAPAGLGKSVAVISELINLWWEYFGTHNNVNAEIYVPSHALADEIASKLTKMFPQKKAAQHWMNRGPLTPVIIRGRDYVDKKGKHSCEKFEVAKLLSQKNWSVYPNLCKRIKKVGGQPQETWCEYFGECGYISQFNEDCHVRIYTHAHLGQDRTFLDKAIPDFAVVDESFYKDLLPTEEIFMSAISNSGWSAPFVDAITFALSTDKPLLKHLRDTLGEEVAYQAIEEAEDMVQQAPIYDLISLSDEKQLQVAQALPESPRLAEFLAVLRRELNIQRDDAYGIAYNDETNRIELRYRRRITRFKNSKKQCRVLAIDADLNPDIHKMFFPDAVCHDIPVERDCRITQIHSTANSARTLFQQGAASTKRQAEIQQFIDTISEGGKKVLVVASQRLTGNPKADPPIAPLLKTANPDDLAHFGYIRGIDRWKDHDAVVIVGRNDPDARGSETAAKALYYDTTAPLNLTGKLDYYEARGYRIRGELQAGVNVRTHADPRVQQVLEQMRECESTQSIDRLRFIHGAEGRQVYLLSNVPLNITVDCLISWTDLIAGGTRLERAFLNSNGVLPLSADLLVKNSGGVIKSVDTAKDALKLFNQMGGNPYYLYIGSSTQLTKYQYRVEGKSGRSRFCLSKYAKEETQAKLEDLLGEKVFDVKKVAFPTDIPLVAEVNGRHAG